MKTYNEWCHVNGQKPTLEGKEAWDAATKEIIDFVEGMDYSVNSIGMGHVELAYEENVSEAIRRATNNV